MERLPWNKYKVSIHNTYSGARTVIMYGHSEQEVLRRARATVDDTDTVLCASEVQHDVFATH
jgi:hypothetical protein